MGALYFVYCSLPYRMPRCTDAVAGALHNSTVFRSKWAASSSRVVKRESHCPSLWLAWCVSCPELFERVLLFLCAWSLSDPRESIYAVQVKTPLSPLYDVGFICQCANLSSSCQYIHRSTVLVPYVCSNNTPITKKLPPRLKAHKICYGNKRNPWPTPQASINKLVPPLSKHSPIFE